MDTYRYHVTLTFTEPLLGTIALNQDLVAEYIASKAPTPELAEQEVETVSVGDLLEKASTGFHRVDGQPILYDYVLKGFAKDACGMLARVPGTSSSKLRAFRKIIDGLMFIEPRQIPIHLSGPMSFLERPLRAQTAQGERVALARSEVAPAGSSISCTIILLGNTISEDTLREWLDYGSLRGLGSWRNASYGRFRYQMEQA
jgi:hypothetical protein